MRRQRGLNRGQEVRTARRSPQRRGWALTIAVGLCAMMFAGTALLAVGTTDGQGSQVTLRRLSQDQYRQSISDIFGSDIRIAGRLEPDPRRDGLIALGVANAAVSAAGFEQYDIAAREIAAQVVAPERRAVLIGCAPANAAAADDACARAFLNRVGRMLYRRPVDPVESDRLVNLAARAAVAKQDFFGGLSIALATMLESPSFLFRTERAVRVGSEYRLDDYSIASRLSFMVWNAPPDAALLTAAERGTLRSPAGLSAQIDRMLASPRFEAGVRAFFSDMLELNALDSLQKDPTIYPRFTPRLAADAREQTLRTVVDTLVRDNADYRSLFTTRRTVLSRSLGLLYQEPVASIAGWERREFPQDDPRAGLLSQPAFLMAHSHPGRSSPTLRGKAVRELLLCQKVPAPPANVDFALVQNVADPQFATARKRLIAHNNEPMCAACHKLMDPLGLPLEGFDGAAAMRTTENSAELDLSGELVGKSFMGAAGLGQALAADPALASCLVNRLYSYGSGRSIESDLPWLDAIREQHATSGLMIRALLRAIALSDEFYRVEVDPAADPKQIATTGVGATRTLAETNHGP